MAIMLLPNFVLSAQTRPDVTPSSSYQLQNGQYRYLINPREDRAQLKKISDLLSLSDAEVNYLDAKMLIDEEVDPNSFDRQFVVDEIQHLYLQLLRLLPPAASDLDKIKLLKKFLYTTGPWNDFEPFLYDHTDPKGIAKKENALLHTYLKTKRGNCVTMPILYLILAEKLGLEVTLTNAPRHIMVHYRDRVTGKTSLIETTSGGNFAREEWVMTQMNISEKAFEKGLYLKPKTRRETVGLISTLLSQREYSKRHFNQVISLTNIHHRARTLTIEDHLLRGAAFGFLSDLIEEDLIGKDFSQYMPAIREFNHYDKIMQNIFAGAKKLGWREDGYMTETPVNEISKINPLRKQ